MTLELDGLYVLFQSQFLAAWAVFLRVGGMMLVLPGFGEQSIPMRVRLALAIALTLIVMPLVQDTGLFQPRNGFELLVLSMPEVFTGLCFGLFLRLFVLSLQIAGTIAAQSTSLSQIFGGSAGVDPQPAMGHLFVVSGLALIAMMGLHVKVAEYIFKTYEMVPFGTIPNPRDLLALGLEQTTKVFSLAFSIAAPFVIASLLYNVTLGIINRAMPQLMVSFVGAPAITAGGLLILAIATPAAMLVWLEHFSMFLMAP